MRRYGLIAGAVALGGLGLAAWHWAGPAAKAQAPAAPPVTIPVQAATASDADVPIEETGLGTVQAFNTVTVKVRVDGELQKVAFTEGQTVKAGDLLAQIDPRPFQAQLDQAVAKEGAGPSTTHECKAQPAARLEPGDPPIRRPTNGR